MLKASPLGMGLGHPRELACLFHRLRTQGKSPLMKQKLVSHQAPNQPCIDLGLGILLGHQSIIFFCSQPSSLRHYGAQVGAWQLCLVYSLSPQPPQPTILLSALVPDLTNFTFDLLTLHCLWNLMFVTTFSSWLQSLLCFQNSILVKESIKYCCSLVTLNLDLDPTC